VSIVIEKSFGRKTKMQQLLGRNYDMLYLAGLQLQHWAGLDIELGRISKPTHLAQTRGNPRLPTPTTIFI
jgi:hypothetical protein